MTTNQLSRASHKDFFNAPAVQKKFAEVVNGNSQQFVASLLSVVNNGALRTASNETILTAAMKAAVLNLPIEPSLGFAYIVPYKGQAQFQIGYKGLIQLAIRSGQFKSINAGKVYKAQLVSYDPLFEVLELDFTQAEDEVAGYFASFELTNGFRKLTYWTKEQAEAHGKRFAQSFNKGPWKTDFDAMAQKTVLKSILGKYAPLSTEMQDAIVADNQTVEPERSTRDITPDEKVEDIAGLIGETEPVAETAVKQELTTRDTSYPADEIPDFVDEETGEILASEGNLFDNLADLQG